MAPIYIVSKGRADSSLTSRTLSEMNVPHYVVVEPSEVQTYTVALADTLATIVPMDLSYKDKYDLCDKLGMTKSTGPGPARNFVWQHSLDLGASWHWVMDDNIRNFLRLHENKKIRWGDRTPFTAMEDFCSRYTNIAMAGPQYRAFAPQNSDLPPYVLNTRIYSCNLIRNDLPFRWRGRYNEDTILSLDMLTAGWCTVQFNAFLQDKLRTQVLGGGNTAEFYAGEGTAPKSRMLHQEYPMLTTLVWKFGREHHHVDYNQFKHRRLARRQDISWPPTTSYPTMLVTTDQNTLDN